MKKALLLVNLGTPLQPTQKEVKKFLKEFLNDPHVIDIPCIFRKLLVHLIIVPFRAKKSTRMYKKLWAEEGSPIYSNLHQLTVQLQNELKSEWEVFWAMRYGSPNLKTTLQSITDAGIEQLTVLPLFPQYASSTTGSIIEYIERELKKMNSPFSLNIVHDFNQHPSFIRAFAQKIKTYQPENFDHIIFSYHSLPVRHVQRIHPEQNCVNCVCEKEMPEYGKNCYKAQCYQTTRLLIASLNLQPNQYSIAFQSRFAKKWIGPFTDDIILQLAKAGKKRVLVVSPSFVADCLETLVEIKIDYYELFKANGGDKLVLVESLNADKTWVQAISKIISDASN